MLREVVQGDLELMDEGRVAVAVFREAIFAGGIVYVKEGDAIYAFGEAVVVGDGVGLGKEIRDEVRRERGKSKFSHFGVSAVGGGRRVWV